MDLLTAAGADHVRLLYDYLDAGDPDGCGSLLHEAVVVELPGRPPARGRTEALRAHALPALPRVRHAVDRLTARDRTVTVTGRRITADGTGREQRFVDVFTVGDDGLLRTWTRSFTAVP
ncbi:nuclear transport factor 2 family protein [Streptomyces gulbargensis]|uniref:Nuclear transport factor 2 family protein n=1 Tax=Streptomyces gulbargensis TaxID=364901 RepID=A0ABP7MGI3_9ACTN